MLSGFATLTQFGRLRARPSPSTSANKSPAATKVSNAERLRELESLRAALDKSQAVIEMAMDGTILSANEGYLTMFGYTLAEIVGKPYTLFVDPAERQAEKYQSLWTHMRAGQYEQGRYKRVGKNAREIWVRASFNPLIDQHGNAWKVVKLASEITPIIIEARALDSTVHEAQEVIQAVLAGAGDRRIDLAGKTGNLELLAISINQMIDGVLTTVAETMEAVQLAVAGDLRREYQLTTRPVISRPWPNP